VEPTNNISEYDYDLPVEFIAQTPACPHESAKLMVVGKNTGSISDRHVFNLPDYFQQGDILVINNTKVFKARLYGVINQKDGTEYKVELFLVHPTNDNLWLALGKPGKKFKPGTEIKIAPDFRGLIINYHADGTMDVKFNLSNHEVIAKSNIYGHVPVPPYIKNEPDSDKYQTSYAKVEGSVAAPTAGFHLTERIRNILIQKGVEILEITLHVGLGTFLPVKTTNLESHHMHEEWSNITYDVANKINLAKINHRRIVAVGTTTVRTLEGIAALNKGILTGYSGKLNLFIKPGFEFKIIDGMLTNFHLPKSTLIILVSAFSGRDRIISAYQHAKENNYRFYSFGDAILII
jgi:S-adenosylmethionine:tRNA ribosyltransferase-isomerase